MCGIVGLFSKSPAVSERLGEHLGDMLVELSDRGPDSAGVALYRDPAPAGATKVSLHSPDARYDWASVHAELAAEFGAGETDVRASHAVVVVDAEARETQDWLRDNHPELRVMSAGQSLEIYKEAGLPTAFVERFALHDIQASHGLGHTRMATESAVTTDGSHPFWTGLDLCLVHNGSLSNHNWLRTKLRREGLEFQTENDSEVAAGYLTWRLARGRQPGPGAGELPRRARRLLHVRGRHRGRLRRAARPDRLQAGRDGRVRRLGGDGLRVPRASRCCRAPRTRPYGSRRRRPSTAGRGNQPDGDDRGPGRGRDRGPRRDLPARAQPAPARPGGDAEAAALAGGEPRRPARDRRWAGLGHRGRRGRPRGLLLRRHEQARDGARARQLRRRPGREHHVGHGGGGRQRQPVRRCDRARRPRGGPRGRLLALRDLDEGRGHRRARIGRAHERLHGPEGPAGGVRRRGRRPRRLDLRGPPVRARLGRGAGRGLRGEGDARGARGGAARAARPRRPGRRGSRRLSPLRLGAPALQLQRRQRGRATDEPERLASRTARVGHLRPQRDRRDPARRARGHLRHPRLRRQAAGAALRRPAVPRRVDVALPARGLPRALRHRGRAGRPLRAQAARAVDPDHDRRHELRRAERAGQGGPRPRRVRGRHLHDDRRRRHDPGGAPVLARRSSTSSCPRATA